MENSTNDAPLTPRDVLTPEEAAIILQLSAYTVLKLLRNGELPGKKIGGQWRVYRRQLQEYLAGKLAPTSS